MPKPQRRRTAEPLTEAAELRIVGGRFRGRKLKHEPFRTEEDLLVTRPMKHRLRETIFNLVSTGAQGRHAIDLFAGTGALGLEALSRGAAFALFIEESAEGRGLIRANVENFGLTGRSKIFRRDATDLGAAGTMQPFGLLFADPPYGNGLGEQALQSAKAGGWLVPGALCVVEESAAAPFAHGPGFALVDERSYGDTVIRILESA
jgi:16S rRNA (guanine966-N2)-methyltransferase